MYAVIRTGGKQYRVASGQKLKIEKLAAEVGSELTIAEVLAIGEGDALRVGAPLVSGASVTATVVSQGLDDKVKVFKFRRRKNYKRTQGHRQPFTEIQITAING